MKPNNPLHLLAAHVDERDRRERLLLALTVAVVMLVVWNALVRTPLAERRAVAVDSVAQLEREIGRASCRERVFSSV